MTMIEQLSLAGIVPVIKIQDAADAVPLAGALAQGGLPVAEITFRTAAAEESIRRVSAALPGVLLGAGTVLTVDQVKSAVDAGAGYIVSPGLNPEVVGYCVQNEIPVLPGCATPSDVERALALGLSTVKFFPAEAIGGLGLIKALAGPYGQMKYVPTGGIHPGNLMEYLAHPKVVACGGSWMVPDALVAAKDFEGICALTRAAVSKLLGFELRHVGINAPDAQGARQGADALCDMFGWAAKEGNSSVFAGEGIELTKAPGRGEHGHIAVATHSIPRALWHLARRGYEVEPGSEVIKDDGVVAVYLKDRVGGFAIHLVRK